MFFGKKSFACVVALFAMFLLACGNSTNSSFDYVEIDEVSVDLDDDSVDEKDSLVVDGSDGELNEGLDDESTGNEEPRDSSKTETVDTSKTNSRDSSATSTPDDTSKVELADTSSAAPADTSAATEPADSSAMSTPDDTTKAEPADTSSAAPADTSATSEPADTSKTDVHDTVVDPCASVKFDSAKSICYNGELHDRYVTRNNFKYEYFVDDRDGQFYRSIKIGNQVWMAQNLNFEIDSSWCAGGSVETSSTNENADCDAYGRLYRWAGAMGVGEDYNRMSASAGPLVDTTKAFRGICPAGWRVPSYHDWYALEDYIYQVVDPDSVNAISTHLKSKELWAEGTYNYFPPNSYNYIETPVPQGINSVGFEALPVGSFVVYNGRLEFEDFTRSTYFLSVNERNGESIYVVGFEYNQVDVSIKHYGSISGGKGGARSLRCIKNEE